MSFWDSSCIVPLVVDEPRSPACRALLPHDRPIAVWVLTSVEVASAVRRLECERRMDSTGARVALDRLERLRRWWVEVSAVDAVVERAFRLLAIHTLASADALQLAAALELVSDRPRNQRFVTADSRLAHAADRTGFDVIVPEG